MYTLTEAQLARVVPLRSVALAAPFAALRGSRSRRGIASRGKPQALHAGASDSSQHRHQPLAGGDVGVRPRPCHRTQSHALYRLSFKMEEDAIQSMRHMLQAWEAEPLEALEGSFRKGSVSINIVQKDVARTRAPAGNEVHSEFQLGLGE